MNELIEKRKTTHDRIRIDKLINDLRSCRCLTAEKVIPLTALNKERKNLPGAKKVTLYVEEYIYLATKYFIQQTDLDLISLKCIESYRWEHDFDGIRME